VNFSSRLLTTLTAVYAVSLGLSVFGQQPPADGPQYENGTSLVRPADYRAWPSIGSGLGLNYDSETAAGAASPAFSNVFVNPASYRGFLQTGVWPNATIFVLEFRQSRTNTAPNVSGRFQGELLALEAEVKDARFPDGWGFFNFGKAGALRPVAAPLSGTEVSSCIECHTKHTAVERTFVQFYPALLEVARQKGTLKPGF
jgi:hypothetical protein